jgi:hypothetical protein
MADYFYGTVASLAWVFGHYFYKREHYVWLAEEYFTYGLPNPKSSDPHLIYQDIYQPWKDRDDYDKFIGGIRLNLRKGVIAKEMATVINSSDASDLKDICDNVDITFLYPLVYKVDITSIPGSRQIKKGSALTGSHEVLVEDLKESEFEILFLDYEMDSDFKQLISDELKGAGPADALNILKGRC